MQELIDKTKELLKKKTVLTAAVIVGIVGMILILVSDSGSGKSETTASAKQDISFETAETYSVQMEEKLKDILSSIDGVGKADVLITITSTEEYVYAETKKQNSYGEENNYVIIDNGSKKEALVKKIQTPEISGVVIVCEGGGKSKVCEKIYRAVSTALGIPTTKIYVAEMK
jgi:stage III sporulation protein AG